MSENQNQPRAQGGWPSQPPVHSAGQPVAPPRRRRRRRRGTALLIALLVLAAALVAVDYGARVYAENMIANKIESSGLKARPSVSIEGWPFLTQIAAHDVGAIDISARDVRAGRLVISTITAKATGVHLNSSFSGATIDQINGTAVITFASLISSLSATIGIPGLNFASITPDPADGPNAATVNIGIASVTAKVVKTGPDQITIEFGQLGGIASLLGGATSIPDQVINIPKLPAGMIIKSVTVTAQGVVVDAGASNTTLTQLSPA